MDSLSAFEDSLSSLKYPLLVLIIVSAGEVPCTTATITTLIKNMAITRIILVVHLILFHLKALLV